MLLCWQNDSSSRPTFPDLVRYLSPGGDALIPAKFQPCVPGPERTVAPGPVLPRSLVMNNHGYVLSNSAEAEQARSRSDNNDNLYSVDSSGSVLFSSPLPFHVPVCAVFVGNIASIRAYSDLCVTATCEAARQLALALNLPPPTWTLAGLLHDLLRLSAHDQ